MIKIIFLVTLFGLWMPITAQSAENATYENLFDVNEDDFLAAAQQSTKSTNKTFALSDFLMQNITTATALPINKAEKIFCYIVDYAEKGYEGYTANGLAIKGYCGELSPEGKTLINDTVFSSASLYSKSRADCRISPKIMLRYVFGIDYTDVLFSYPCPALTFFHGNNIAVLNAGPGEAVIEKIVTAYTSLNEEFHSPALLGQMVGSGVPQTQAQKDIIRRNAPTEAPRKKWNNESSAETPTQSGTIAPKPATGWNKLR